VSPLQSYAVVTPVRDEVENLSRLAECLREQTLRPETWVIVDTGSDDGTLALAASLANGHDWITVRSLAANGARAERGPPIVRAFHEGLKALEHRPDVLVKLDADVSIGPSYFERLLDGFRAEPKLGIAGGSAYEEEDGMWRRRHMTRTSVWGAARAYRRACLEDVLPLEERMGWDSIDEFKANVHGWRTRTFLDLPFRHHRREGGRELDRRSVWSTQGRLAYYLGYRPSYLVVRSLFRTLREPAALAMLPTYAGQLVRRQPRYPDRDVRAYLRDQQRARRLWTTAQEALGRRGSRLGR
jgi:biofilm PGA synthesis N-glycosyltransferase PgaC